MRDLLSGLLGVPAVVLCAGGAGIMIVTLVSRIRARGGGHAIRWAHLGLGVGMLGAGGLLFKVALAVAPGG